MIDHDIDEFEAALITHRIGQSFAFVRDVLNNPALLELIPDKVELVFRDFTANERDFRLTAYSVSDTNEIWEARVTGPLVRDSGGLGSFRDVFSRGDTAELALDALESAIRDGAFDPLLSHAATA